MRRRACALPSGIEVAAGASAPWCQVDEVQRAAGRGDDESWMRDAEALLRAARAKRGLS